jgi:tetratricopeptide (TPR) repeat protein
MVIRPQEEVVFDSQRMLKHLAFFEELANLDESDPAFRAVSAGLVVLRLVDAWIEEGPRTVTADSWGVRAVRTIVEEADPGTPVRAILESIVDALDEASVVDMHAVAPRLMAYGHALDYEARWTLAADVYQTLIGHTHPLEDSDVAIVAHLQLAVCLRMLGDTEAAAESYRRAGQIAEAVGDMMGVLRARIGDAKIAIARGNLPHADGILADTAERAAELSLTNVRSMALHDRASIAVERGQYEQAIRFAYDALDGTNNERERDRVLADIAGAFYKLGVRSAARDAYVVLAATGQEQYQRWVAVLNLLEIAADDGQEPVFERYRRSLVDENLPPRLRALYLVQAGQGYHRLGHVHESRLHLQRAVEYAAQHKLNQIMFEAESALQDVKTARRAPTRFVEAPASVYEDVADVAAAIRDMRQLVST